MLKINSINSFQINFFLINLKKSYKVNINIKSLHFKFKKKVLYNLK